MDLAEKYIKELRKILMSFNTDAMRRFVLKYRALQTPQVIHYATHAEDKYLRGSMAKMVLASNNMPKETIERAKRILDELNWGYGLGNGYGRKN